MKFATGTRHHPIVTVMKISKKFKCLLLLKATDMAPNFSFVGYNSFRRGSRISFFTCSSLWKASSNFVPNFCEASAGCTEDDKDH
mmetsp:Transcript_16751/g.21279  ORF Transcript_16751/g.21279 Transcript_16751/m.21279 type:complete len:85 (+) Transcript_16751:1333-1587(+)